MDGAITTANRIKSPKESGVDRKEGLVYVRVTWFVKRVLFSTAKGTGYGRRISISRPKDDGIEALDI